MKYLPAAMVIAASLACVSATRAATIYRAAKNIVAPQQTRQAVALLREEWKNDDLPSSIVRNTVRNALAKAPNNPELKFASVIFDASDEKSKEGDDWFDSIGFRRIFGTGENIPLSRQELEHSGKADFIAQAQTYRNFAQEVPNVMKYLKTRHAFVINRLKTTAVTLGNSPMMRRLERAVIEWNRGEERAYRDACIPMFQGIALLYADFYTLLSASYDDIRFQGDWKTASANPAIQEKLDSLIAELEDHKLEIRCIKASGEVDVQWNSAFRKAVFGSK